MSQPAPHIQFKGVTLRFPSGQVEALRGIDLSIPEGEVLTVLGPSGCGKTSLLRLIAGLVQPSEGSVLVKGAPPRLGHESAIVFQNFRLLPWRTVEENVGLPLGRKGARDPRVAECLATVGLTRFAKSYPRQLSGGMQQRVALARALVADPAILLMDEPFASLDAQSRELMQTEVSRLAHGSRTVVFVTHSVDEALLLGDRVLLMAPRPGRVHRLIPLPFARQGAEARKSPEFAALREELWADLREMVLSDPLSDFHGRGHAVSDR